MHSEFVPQHHREHEASMELSAIRDDVMEKEEGGRRIGGKPYRRGTYDWAKEYIYNDVEGPTYRAENITSAMCHTKALQKEKQNWLQYRLSFWSTRMVGGKRPRNPTDVKMLACMNTWTTGGSGDTSEDFLYMAEQTTEQYFNSFCKDIVDM